jgi:NTP pyrophosphatase (non-canonical NTP hydrolase)
MRLDDYQRLALESDMSRGKATARYLLLGLFGEAGGVLTAVKKRERDEETSKRYLAQVSEEIGDLLWYFAAVSSRNGTTLGQLAEPLLRGRSVPPNLIQFSDLQPPRTQIATQPSKYLEYNLIDLAEAVGSLVRAQTQSLSSRQPSSASHAFTDVLHRVVTVANRVGLDLADVAQSNLKKVGGRWPRIRTYPRPFDTRYPKYERLPRDMVIDMREVIPNPGQYFVLQTCQGVHVGDRLTDNIEDEDGYRFHDVFHYAYAAIIGWSPVLRSLLRLKRKSNKEVDEAQDGARAILIEEGIAALVFNEAKSQAFFKHVKRGKLSFDLLKTIQAFVRGYEVEEVPLWVWEDAILQGFAAFRHLREHRTGRVIICQPRRKLIVKPHP